MTTTVGSTATYAPLLAQRRRLRERALAVFYRGHDDRSPAVLPVTAVLDPTVPAAPPSVGKRRGFLRWLLGASFTGNGSLSPLNAESAAPRDSAAATAALVQRLTGPGSGPYSGTPFRPSADASGRCVRTTDGAVSEAARHDHGIIDHSRHVSSIGRR
jgi:hypothetical protein